MAKTETPKANIFVRINAVLSWFFSDLWEGLIKHIPSRMGPFPIGYRLRQNYWSKKCKAFGDNVLIQENVNLYFPQMIEIGSNVSITANCILSAGVSESSKITVGNDIFFGPGCMIFSCNHDYTKPNIKQEPAYVCAPITVGDNVWLGSMVGVVSGVNIGEGSVVAMGSVVTSDVDPETIVAGSPARPINSTGRDLNNA